MKLFNEELTGLVVIKSTVFSEASFSKSTIFFILNISRHENHRYTFEIHQYT